MAGCRHEHPQCGELVVPVHRPVGNCQRLGTDRGPKARDQTTMPSGMVAFLTTTTMPLRM
jgi:hypothetical protein